MPYFVVSHLGSHCLFSIDSYDKCSFLKHPLRKTQQEDWKQGNCMTLISDNTDAFLLQVRTVSARSGMTIGVLLHMRGANGSQLHVI